MALTKVSGDILDNGINVAGVVTATAFHGPLTGPITGTASTASFATTAYSLSGNVGDIIANDITNRHINSSGIVTATAFYGSGVNLTGVSGFGTALDNTQGTLGNLLYTTPTKFTVGAGLTSYVSSNDTAGNYVYTRLDEIIVGSGATVHIASDTEMVMDVLDLDGSLNIARGTSSGGGGGGGGSSTFLGLTDSPSSFEADKWLKVNSSATTLEWTTAPSGGISNLVDDTTPQLGGNLDLNSKYITGTGGANVTGVVTATSFVGNVTGNATGLSGTPDITIGNLVGVAATFTGVLTYEDVTSIDSVGVITARKEIVAQGGIFEPHGSTVTYTVKVASKTAAHRYQGTGSGSGYFINGTESPFITLTPGRTYKFDTSDSSVSNHTLRFYRNADKTDLYVGSTKLIYTMDVTNNSFTDYVFSNGTDRNGSVSGNDPTININVGDTLKITNNAGAAHPLWLNTTNSTGTSNGITQATGGTVTNNGSASNGVEVSWTPHTAGTYFYNCQHHAGMSGSIIVTDNTNVQGGVIYGGNTGAATTITVTDSTPDVLHYQCINHGYMGNAVQTNSNDTAPLGGGNDKAFFLNDLTITESYTIPPDKNAGTFGPIQIAAGKVVTIPATSFWTIV